MDISESQCEPQVVDKLIVSSEQNGVNADRNNNSHHVQLQIDYDAKESKQFTIFGYGVRQIKWTNVVWLFFIHTLAITGWIYAALFPVKFWTVW